MYYELGIFYDGSIISWPFSRQVIQLGIFTHLKLCLADAIHNFKRVKIITIWLNGGLRFWNLLIDVTFYLQHVKNLVFNVLINKWKKNKYGRDGFLKGCIDDRWLNIKCWTSKRFFQLR